MVESLANLRGRAPAKRHRNCFTINKTYRSAWRWVFLNSLLVLVPHGGQPRELRINRKTGEFIAGRDIVPVAERAASLQVR